MDLFFRHQASLARGHSVDSLHNAEALRDGDGLAEARDVLVTRRDESTVRQLDDYILSCEGRDETAGILFGAGHMPAIVHHLIENHGYTVGKAEWLSVISLP